MKNRKQKAQEYQEKYGHIPIDYKERLYWMYDHFHMTEVQSAEVLYKKQMMISSMFYTDIDIILFEVPEGSPRPRFRIVNRSNFTNMAMSNSQFVHVYSITGHEDSVHMQRLLTQNDFAQLNQLIYTPCNVDINAFLQTPTYYSKQDIILAEIGLERPINKPDWDNIEKKYSDMFNKNIWLDDTLVVDGAIHRYYSILPRIEIRVRYLNMLYNKYQYNQMINRTDLEPGRDIKYFKMN